MRGISAPKSMVHDIQDIDDVSCTEMP
ncbi:TPA: hypothetical protein ACHWWS_004506 [Escherichia coli]